MPNSQGKDSILTTNDLNQVFPCLRIIGGKKPIVILTGSTLKRAVALAEGRASDTGCDVRVLGLNAKVLYQANSFD